MAHLGKCVCAGSVHEIKKNLKDVNCRNNSFTYYYNYLWKHNSKNKEVI